MTIAVHPAASNIAEAASGTPTHLSPITVEIGGLPVRLLPPDAEFREVLLARYSSYVREEGGSLTPKPAVQFELHAAPFAPSSQSSEGALQVACSDSCWQFTRNDFHAVFDTRTRRGTLNFAPNPYSVDTLLRVLHSILLARTGGLLLHASSAIRHGHGLLFSGISGAGKTTIARLAPPDVRLLTDEVSYLRREGSSFRVFGTPFSGELGIQGENVSAPVRALYLIEHGVANHIERVPEVEAVRRLMRNTLFFAHEKCLVGEVFSTVCDLARHVPVYRLEFLPDSRVWEAIA